MTETKWANSAGATLRYPPVGVAGRSVTPARTLIDRLGGEFYLVAAIMIASAVAHGVNMFEYPSFTWLADEGTYVSEAWAVARTGQLAHYTYMYGHVPGGWILLAALNVLAGGPRALEMPVNLGRALMLVLHVLMVPLLYRLSRRLGCPPAAAALAVFVFSVSPLAIYYQRMFLLDNVMLFWTLLSLNLLLDEAGRLSRVALSGLCFALALLSKETDVVLIPVFLFVVWRWRWPHHSKFAMVVWLMPMVVVTSWYPLYASLKGELLPESFALQVAGQTISFGSGPHVSLLEALAWQSGRGGGGIFDQNNAFFVNLRIFWLPKDTILLASGTIVTVGNVARGLVSRRRDVFAAGLLGLMPIVYLVHGGIVFQHYILFAIPFLCLNLAVLLAPLLLRLTESAGWLLMGVVAAALLGYYGQSGQLQPLYTVQASKVPRDVIIWIKQNLPSSSVIIARDSWWPDLREPGLGGGAFLYVEDQWQVDSNKDVKDAVLHDDWHSVDYLLMLPDMMNFFRDSNSQIGLTAYANACRLMTWHPADQDTVDLWRVDKSGALGNVPHVNGEPKCPDYADPPLSPWAAATTSPSAMVGTERMSRSIAAPTPVRVVSTPFRAVTPNVPPRVESLGEPVADRPLSAATPTRSQRTYIVQPGDTIRGIAVRMYGNPDAWRVIVAANSAQIQNPNQIHVGQHLILPPVADHF